MESPFIKTTSGLATVVITSAAATLLALAFVTMFPNILPTSIGQVRF